MLDVTSRFLNQKGTIGQKFTRRGDEWHRGTTIFSLSTTTLRQLNTNLNGDKENHGKLLELDIS